MRLWLVQTKHLLILLCLLVALTGCSDNTGTTTTINNVTSSATNTPTITNTATGLPNNPVTASPTETPFPPTPDAATASKLGSDWLHGIPCQVPCWEGIVPGHTKAAEALDLLRHNPLVSASIFSTFGRGGLMWEGFGNNKPEGEIRYEYDSALTTVYYISVYIPSYKIKLSDLIQFFGPPTHVWPQISSKVDTSHPPSEYFTPTYGFSIVYLNKGFEIDSGYFDQPPLLNGDLELSNPVFFVPDADGFHAAHHVNGSVADLAEWQGFRDFNYYCNNTNFTRKSECPGQK